MTVQASFAATLADEWGRAGVADVVVSPGSRSSPLTLAVLADERLSVHVRLDERAGGFFAIGCALGANRPVVVITTSGTATAELHAAVLEADLAGVPLIICTADRPPELDSVGAPQTVDQRGLYGGAVRFFAQPGVPDAAMSGSWRSIASRLVAEACAGPAGPGPVHANFAFREPLGGAPDELPPGRSDGRPWHEVDRPPSAASSAIDQFVAELRGVERGLLIVGAGGGDPTAACGLAASLGWPVLADPRAWPREPRAGLITKADMVLRSAKVRNVLRPDVVVHLGSPHASRVVGEWHAETGAAGTRHLLVDPFGRFADPERVASIVVTGHPLPLLHGARERLGADKATTPSDAWLAQWERADAAAGAAIAAELDQHREVSEPGVARAVVAAMPRDAALVVAASMPVRDLEWFTDARAGAPVVFANRGANGIDGTISTILGVASTASRPVLGVLGDLAFLHDLSGLVFGAAETVPDATLVVIDNAGGGIFSFLSYADVLEHDRFERAFGTAQRAPIPSVAAALGCHVHEVADLARLTSAIRRSFEAPGIDVIVVRTDRAENAALHGRLVARAVEAVETALGARGAR